MAMDYSAASFLLQGLDLNILPERYRPRRLSARQALLALVVGVAVILPLPLYRVVERNAIHTLHLEIALKHAQAEAKQPLQHMKEAQELQKALAQVQEKAQALDKGHQNLIARRRIWSDSLGAIIQVVPSRASLSSIKQEGGLLSIKGRVGSPTIAVDYALALEEAGIFSEVRIIQLALSESRERPTEALFTITVEK